MIYLTYMAIFLKDTAAIFHLLWKLIAFAMPLSVMKCSLWIYIMLHFSGVLRVGRSIRCLLKVGKLCQFCLDPDLSTFVLLVPRVAQRNRKSA